MLNTIFSTLWNSSRNYCHKFKKNHNLYDVLKLNRNCTTDEIRNSYLKLSKQCHPDVNGITNCTKNAEQFIKITEAYNVLSKRNTREMYDVDLYTWEMSNGLRRAGDQHKNASGFHQPWRVKPNYGPYSNPSEYYGMKGVKKVSNIKIVAVISLFVIVGTAFEFLLVRNSFTLSREKLDDLSKEANNQHANIRADAEKYGNKKQLERMAEKILKKY